MMKTLLAMLLLVQMAGAQMISMGNHRKIFPAGSCTPPTETSRWPFYGAGVTCLSGACTGQDSIRITAVPDVVGTNNLGLGGLARPFYFASGAGGFASLASGHFDGGSDLALGTSIATAVTTISYWNTIQLNAMGISAGMLGGAPGALEFRIGTTNHLELLISNIALIGSGTTTFATGKYTVGFTLNTTTGAWNLYKCSGGSCTVDGSGTYGAVTFTNPITSIGTANGTSDIFNGLILESGYLNGISTAGWGTWSQCNAGI